MAVLLVAVSAIVTGIFGYDKELEVALMVLYSASGTVYHSNVCRPRRRQRICFDDAFGQYRRHDSFCLCLSRHSILCREYFY